MVLNFSEWSLMFLWVSILKHWPLVSSFNNQLCHSTCPCMHPCEMIIINLSSVESVPTWTFLGLWQLYVVTLWLLWCIFGVTLDFFGLFCSYFCVTLELLCSYIVTLGLPLGYIGSALELIWINFGVMFASHLVYFWVYMNFLGGLPCN